VSEAVLIESGHRRLRRIGLAMAVLAFVADQGHKLAMLYGFGFAQMAPGEAVPVTSFFNLVMVWNPGISYGLFPATSPWGTALQVSLTLGMIAFLAWWLWKSSSLAVSVGCGLVVGGGLGNLLDRVVYGRVADFFHFHGFGYNWYVFNIADVAVTLGAIAFIYDVLKPSESSNDA
jgi:signal peptidase II